MGTLFVALCFCLFVLIGAEIHSGYYLCCVDGGDITIVKTHSNKPWSRDNKFVVTYNGTAMHMKKGQDSIVYEYAYYQLARQMQAREIVVHTKIVALGSFIAVLFPWQDTIVGGWGVSKQCHDKCNARAFKIMIIDYLIGYVDRPANCHTVNKLLYAVDNDSGSASLQILPTKESYQYNIIDDALKGNRRDLFSCFNVTVTKVHRLYTPVPPNCFSQHQATLWKQLFGSAAARLRRLQRYVTRVK